MRTLLLVGVAAGSLFLAERASSAEVAVEARGALTELSASQVAMGHHPRTPTLDYSAGYPGDARVYTGQPDRMPAEEDYRHVEGGDYQGTWQGQWNGTYESPEGERYHGTYDGTYSGNAGTDYDTAHGQPYQQGYRTGYDQREAADMDRYCRGTSGVGGAAVGGAIGGVVGNRVAKRGDRLGGTLIGVGVGGLVGMAIDKGADKRKCQAWLRQRDAQDGAYYQGGGYQGGGYAPTPYPPQGGGHYQGGGYYQGGQAQGYYSPGVVVTTIIMPAAPVITETVTTTTTYETISVPVRHRYVAKKRYYKPRPKPRCTCR